MKLKEAISILNLESQHQRFLRAVRHPIRSFGQLEELIQAWRSLAQGLEASSEGFFAAHKTITEGFERARDLLSQVRTRTREPDENGIIRQSDSDFKQGYLTALAKSNLVSKEYLVNHERKLEALSVVSRAFVTTFNPLSDMRLEQLTEALK